MARLGSVTRLLAYSCLLHLVLPVVFMRLAWAAMTGKPYGRRWKERFGILDIPRSSARTICIHAVSVGEVLSCAPLIAQLRSRYSGARFIVTTVTPTGAEMVRARLDGDVLHCYFPYDLGWAVNAFLSRIRPDLVLVMETELWPNFFAACRAQDIPIAIVNARISPRSLRGYRKIRALVRDTLACVGVVAAQTPLDARRYLELGMTSERLHVVGNLKFDILVPPTISEQGQALRRSFPDNFLVWTAASTHDGEEAQVLAAFRLLRRTFPDCLLVLAPRHPHRFEEVAQLCRRQGFRWVRRTSCHEVRPDTEVFLLDTLGELLPFYAASDVAFVGGSMVTAGGHNPLEPASLGIPLVTGAHTFNFTEIMELLADAGAVRVVDAPGSLAETVGELLGDPNLRHAMGEGARRVFASHRGATARAVDLLVPLDWKLHDGTLAGTNNIVSAEEK